ncbi:hypothetical protein [Planctomyces sp. SH-PL14]|uniref:hypothetical protein n=1 Tax=Planctomyces sp. SH-PL14 TaxID=1632864 RepID=UPI00078C7FE8|nr:hypothetical protein [Planctomyces sp. SH-PL14]AMV16798.1 hypothetical protein VT03_02840 [Planctomyces sp. SH-PL14]
MRVAVCVWASLMWLIPLQRGFSDEKAVEAVKRRWANPACTCLLVPLDDPDDDGYQPFWTDYNHLDCNSPVSGGLIAMCSNWPHFCYTSPDACDCLGGAPAEVKAGRLAANSTTRVGEFPGLRRQTTREHNPVEFVLRHPFPSHIRPPEVYNDDDEPVYLRIQVAANEWRIYQVHKIRFHLGGTTYRTVHLGKEYVEDRPMDNAPVPRTVDGAAVAVDVNARATFRSSNVHRLTDGILGDLRLPPMVLLSYERKDGRIVIPENKAKSPE